MSLLRAVSVSRAPVFGLAMVGIFWGSLAAMMPDLKARIGATDAQFGMVLLGSALGGIASMYLAPKMGEWVGRLILPLAGFGLALAAFYPLLPGSVAAFALIMIAVGASVAMLDISANMRIAALEARHGLHLMNVNHAMFSFGFGGAALLVGIARSAGYGPVQILPVIALILAVTSLGMAEGRGPLDAGGEDAEPPTGRLPWPLIGLAAVILLCSFIGENAVEAWSALHIERTLGGAAGHGGFGPATLGISMGLARLLGQLAAERLGEERLVLWSAVLGATGTVVIGAAPTQLWVLIGVGIVGVGMAVVVPSANSILGKRVRHDQRAVALSRAWMIGFVGFFVGPTLMGLLSEAFGLRVSFYVIAAIIAVIVPAVIGIERLKMPVRSR